MREYASVFALGLLALIASVQSIAGEASISNIVIMLKRDVGLDSPIPLEASYLQRLSLKSGLDLTWQANTRTNGQILSLPMGVSPEQAKQATKILAKEPGVLWAHSGDLVDSVTSSNISKSTHDDVVSIAEFIIKFHGDDLNREISPLLLDKLALAAGRPVSIAGRTAQARIVALGTTINKDRADELQRVFESLPEVIYADPNGTAYTDGYSPMITPNDPLFWRGWQLQSSMPVNTPEPNGYPGAANVQAAWALSKGRSNQGVAVIDTGILFDHPDIG